MEAPAMHIFRGQEWGARLAEEMAPSPLTEVDWMDQHTQALKGDVYSRVGLLHLHDTLCCLKFYRAKSLAQEVLFRWGYARGVKSFDAAAELLRAGVRVPAPLSCLLMPRGIMLLTEGVAQSKDLRALWQENIDHSQRESLMTGAGHLLASLHRAGFCHGDCKWSNLLFSQGEFYLVDLEGVRRVTIHGGKQNRDLARFIVNAEDLAVPAEIFECFLDSYLQGSSLSREALIRAVTPDMKRLRKRHARKYGQRGKQLVGDSRNDDDR